MSLMQGPQLQPGPELGDLPEAWSLQNRSDLPLGVPEALRSVPAQPAEGWRLPCPSEVIGDHFSSLLFLLQSRSLEITRIAVES